jgi:hypothetical protein
MNVFDQLPEFWINGWFAATKVNPFDSMGAEPINPMDKRRCVRVVTVGRGQAESTACVARTRDAKANHFRKSLTLWRVDVQPASFEYSH